MFIGPCIIAIVDEWKTNLMSLVILFHLLCAQHVSDINISIFRSLRLSSCSQFVVCWNFCCGWYLVVFVLQASACKTKTTKYQSQQKFQHTTNWEQDDSRKLLKMDILMSETCWAYNKWNKIASDIKLVFHSSTNCLFRYNRTLPVQTRYSSCHQCRSNYGVHLVICAEISRS